MTVFTSRQVRHHTEEVPARAGVTPATVSIELSGRRSSALPRVLEALEVLLLSAVDTSDIVAIATQAGLRHMTDESDCLHGLLAFVASISDQMGTPAAIPSARIEASDEELRRIDAEIRAFCSARMVSHLQKIANTFNQFQRRQIGATANRNDPLSAEAIEDRMDLGVVSAAMNGALSLPRQRSQEHYQ